MNYPNANSVPLCQICQFTLFDMIQHSTCHPIFSEFMLGRIGASRLPLGKFRHAKWWYASHVQGSGQWLSPLSCLYNQCWTFCTAQTAVEIQEKDLGAGFQGGVCKAGPLLTTASA